MAEGLCQQGFVSRISSEFQLSTFASLSQLECGDYDRAIVFLTLLRVCLPDWTGDGRLRRPQELTRSGSTKSLARSLERPPQTIRRHVRNLRERGLCVAEPQGVAVNAHGRDAKKVLTYLLEIHDILLRTVEDLDRAAVLKARPPASAGPIEGAVVRTALDMCLAPFAILRDTLGNWTGMLVWGAISTANTHHIMLDPVLNRRFAVEPTPDELRKPVSLHSVAAAIDVAYATAWRQAERLRQAGLVARRDGGWLLTSCEFYRADIESAMRELATYCLRRLDQLVAEGLDPAAIPALYRDKRPPLAAIGRPEPQDPSDASAMP